MEECTGRDTPASRQTSRRKTFLRRKTGRRKQQSCLLGMSSVACGGWFSYRDLASPAHYTSVLSGRTDLEHPVGKADGHPKILKENVRSRSVIQDRQVSITKRRGKFLPHPYHPK